MAEIEELEGIVLEAKVVGLALFVRALDDIGEFPVGPLNLLQERLHAMDLLFGLCVGLVERGLCEKPQGVGGVVGDVTPRPVEVVDGQGALVGLEPDSPKQEPLPIERSPQVALLAGPPEGLKKRQRGPVALDRGCKVPSLLEGVLPRPVAPLEVGHPVCPPRGQVPEGLLAPEIQEHPICHNPVGRPLHEDMPLRAIGEARIGLEKPPETEIQPHPRVRSCEKPLLEMGAVQMPVQAKCGLCEDCRYVVHELEPEWPIR